LAHLRRHWLLMRPGAAQHLGPNRCEFRYRFSQLFVFFHCPFTCVRSPNGRIQRCEPSLTTLVISLTWNQGGNWDLIVSMSLYSSSVHSPVLVSGSKDLPHLGIYLFFDLEPAATATQLLSPCSFTVSISFASSPGVYLLV
jgi:hypothetical protein